MKKTVILLFVVTVFMYACNTTKSLETEVTMSIDSDFDVTIENKGKSDFSQNSFSGNNITFMNNKALKKDSGKIIKSIFAYITDNTGFDYESYEEKNYNNKGLLISEYNHIFYLSKEFEYDSLNRITKLDALYGESFANGVTKYSYKGNETLQQEFAAGYYSEMLITNTDFDSVLRIESLMVSGDYGENKKETQQYYYNGKNQLVKLIVKKTYYDLNVNMDDLLLLKPVDIKTKLLDAKISSTEKINRTYEYNQDGNIKLDTETFIKSGRILKTEYFYDKKTKLKTREIFFDDTLMVYDWNFKYTKNKNPAKEIKHNYKKVFSDRKNNIYSIADNLITVEYFYNNNSELIQLKESESNKNVINKYFKAGKLIKRQEHNIEGELLETIDYEYFYW